MRKIAHFIDGAAVKGASGRFGDVSNPNTGEIQARVQLATEAELDRAVQSALRAQQTWALVNPQRRARVMFEKGFFIGPTLFDRVTPQMKTYQEEIFGPVLQIVCAETFEDALRLPSEYQYGNGVAIFTRNGRAAREFASCVNVGMVGINVPIPVPVAYHTFGGWKRSAFGDVNHHGMEGVRFYTKVKTITAPLARRAVRGQRPSSSRR